MLYKVIIRLFICSIGVVLINLITYAILSLNYEANIGSWPNIISEFFRDLLFKNNFHLFHYSIILSILGFVSFLRYEYFFDQRRLNDEATLTMSIKNDLITIVALSFFWGLILFLIGAALGIGNIVFLLFLKIPYSIGWEVLFLGSFFEHPTVYSYIIYENDAMWEIFIISLIYPVFFLLTLFASFAKISRIAKTELPFWSNFWLSESTYKYHNKIRLVYFLYLIYLAPTIYVWLYPIFHNWLDILPSDSLGLARIRFFYKVLSYLFVSGFLFIIYFIFRNNRRVMLKDMKEEIKIEIMKEKKPDHNSL